MFVYLFYIAYVLPPSSQCHAFSIYLPVGCNRLSDKLENVYPISTLLHENEINIMTDYAEEVITMLPIPDYNEK